MISRFGMQFLGSLPYQMDERNRVAIPPKYREQFDAPAVLTTSRDRCISVYTQASFERAAEEIEAIPANTLDGREQRRFFYGNAFPVAKDAQHRLLIPPTLLAHAGLTKDVMVVGAGQWFEIWDKARYDEHQQALALEAQAKGE
jgi:MraZ protein